jgi:protein-S-isoprenylcysteine O-methyltransferase Ste14
VSAADSSYGTPRTERRGLARWTVFTLDHILPATLFMLTALGNAMTLGEIIAGTGPTAGVDAVERAWLLAHRVLTTLFACLIAILFAIRRPRHNQRIGLIAELGALLVHPGDPALRKSVGQQIIPAIVAIAGTNGLVLASLAPITETSQLFVVPGTVLGAIGLALAIVSLASLGRSFGVFPEARSLVTHGPYQWIRHPLYLTEIISALGWLLVNLSPFTAANFVLFVGLQYWRTVFEERTLSQEFPEYGEYRKRTWRILPGIH